MIHLDLFSGIGGFSLAAQAVWGDEYKCVGFCEIDRYCQELLKMRFKGVPIYGDIRELKLTTMPTKIANTENIGEVMPSEVNGKWTTKIDLLTGGFP